MDFILLPFHNICLDNLRCFYPMFNLNNLEKEQEHEMILKLQGDEFNNLKSVVCIHLGKFKEALKYVQKNTFEAAYVYYKLKNFKKALKIISKFSDDKANVLKSQILYSMGYYNKAYESLRQIPKDDEVVINLQAMKSMAILTSKVNKACGHKLWIKKRDDLVDFDNLNNFKFTSEENHTEFVYNKTFENADSVESHLKSLQESKAFVNAKQGSIISKQINNIEGTFDEIDFDTLNKTQKEILLFNMKKTSKTENSIHYLKNFTGKMADSEYNWCQEAKSKDFNLSPYLIPPVTDNLKLLRIFIGLKNKSMSKAVALKEADDFVNDNYKEIIRKYFSDDVETVIEPAVSNLTI